MHAVAYGDFLRGLISNPRGVSAPTPSSPTLSRKIAERVDVTREGFLVREFVDGLSREELQARTGAPLNFAPDCKPLTAPPIALPE